MYQQAVFIIAQNIHCNVVTTPISLRASQRHKWGHFSSLHTLYYTLPCIRASTPSWFKVKFTLLIKISLSSVFAPFPFVLYTPCTKIAWKFLWPKETCHLLVVLKAASYPYSRCALKVARKPIVLKGVLSFLNVLMFPNLNCIRFHKPGEFPWNSFIIFHIKWSPAEVLQVLKSHTMLQTQRIFNHIE